MTTSPVRLISHQALPDVSGLDLILRGPSGEPDLYVHGWQRATLARALERLAQSNQDVRIDAVTTAHPIGEAGYRLVWLHHGAAFAKTFCATTLHRWRLQLNPRMAIAARPAEALFIGMAHLQAV